MDNISFQDMEAMIRRTVREELDGHCANQCPLLEADISHEDHKHHHITIRKVIKDTTYIRRAFVAGVLLTITGGVAGLMWAFFKEKIGFLPIGGK